MFRFCFIILLTGFTTSLSANKANLDFSEAKRGIFDPDDPTKLCLKLKAREENNDQALNKIAYFKQDPSNAEYSLEKLVDAQTGVENCKFLKLSTVRVPGDWDAFESHRGFWAYNSFRLSRDGTGKASYSNGDVNNDVKWSLSGNHLNLSQGFTSKALRGQLVYSNNNTTAIVLRSSLGSETVLFRGYKSKSLWGREKDSFWMKLKSRPQYPGKIVFAKWNVDTQKLTLEEVRQSSDLEKNEAKSQYTGKWTVFIGSKNANSIKYSRYLLSTRLDGTCEMIKGFHCEWELSDKSDRFIVKLSENTHLGNKRQYELLYSKAEHSNSARGGTWRMTSPKNGPITSYEVKAYHTN